LQAAAVAEVKSISARKQALINVARVNRWKRIAGAANKRISPGEIETCGTKKRLLGYRGLIFASQFLLDTGLAGDGGNLHFRSFVPEGFAYPKVTNLFHD
jgi:hypothetical protein